MRQGAAMVFSIDTSASCMCLRAEVDQAYGMVCMRPVDQHAAGTPVSQPAVRMQTETKPRCL